MNVETMSQSRPESMSESLELTAQFQSYMENPLLWPMLEVLRKQPSGWKVHTSIR